MSDNRRTDETSPPDDRLGRKAAEVFAGSVERLDGATRSRLAQARAAAVEALAPRPSQRWLPTGGPRIAALGLAAGLAVAIVWMPERASVPTESLTAFDDLDLLLEEEELELFEELEFYAWLDAEVQADETLLDADNSG